jgi:hypothetical protein
MTPIPAGFIQLRSSVSEPWSLHRNHQPPTVGEDEVLVRNSYVGLNPFDWKGVKHRFSLKDLPSVLGRDGSGIIVSVGPAVTGLKQGDRVSRSDTPARCVTDNQDMVLRKFGFTQQWSLSRILGTQGGRSRIASSECVTTLWSYIGDGLVDRCHRPVQVLSTFYRQAGFGERTGERSLDIVRCKEVIPLSLASSRAQEALGSISYSFQDFSDFVSFAPLQRRTTEHSKHSAWISSWTGTTRPRR